VQAQLKMDDVSIVLGNKGVLLKLYTARGDHVGDLRIGTGDSQLDEWQDTRGTGQEDQAGPPAGTA